MTAIRTKERTTATATTGATISGRGDLRPQGPATEEATRPLERPVFVADHPWRHRAANAALATAALLLLVWLMAIVAGALGFGSLPALPLVPHSHGTNSGASESGAGAKSRPAESVAGSHTNGATAAVGTPESRPAGTPASGSHETHAGTKSHAVNGQPHPVETTSAPSRHGVSRSPVQASNPTTHENGNSGTVGVGAERSGSTPAPAEGAPTTTPSGNELPQKPQGGNVGQGDAVNEGVAGEEHRATPRG